MLVAAIENLNYAAGTVLAAIVNGAIPAAAAIGLMTLAAWLGKGWNAASRYCAWWLLIGLVVALPLIPHVNSPENFVVEPMAAPRISTQPTLTLESRPLAAPVDSESAWPSAPTVFLFCWMAAACLQLQRVLRGLLRGAQLKRHAYAPPFEIASLFDNVVERAGVSRRVTLRLSDELDSPALLGYRNAQILLPASLVAQLEPGELEQILLHELAHLNRRDDYAIAVQRAVEAIGIFHPLLAYLGYRLNIDREIACDDRVRSVCEPRDYAACLTRIAELRQFGSASPATVPLLLERKAQLVARVESLLDTGRAHRPAVSIPRLLVVFACVGTAAFAGGFTPQVVAPPSFTLAMIALPAPPEPKPAADDSQAISSLSVTGDNGSTSKWGEWTSQEEKNEPGTITFSSHGKRYIIRDHATVAEAQKLLKPMEELGKQQSTLGEQQAALGKLQAALGEKQASLASTPLNAAAEEHLRQQLQQLQARLSQIDMQKEMKTAQDAMERLGSLQAELGRMQSQMAREQSLMGEKQGELGEQQGKLGEQQGRLGEKQGELGQQQARAAERARKLLEDLVRRAQEKGLAQPLPD